MDPNDRTGTVAVLSQAAVLSHAAALSPRLGTCAGTTKYTNDFSPNERTIIRNSTREPSTRGENKVRLCRSAGLQADTLQRDCRQQPYFREMGLSGLTHVNEYIDDTVRLVRVE